MQIKTIVKAGLYVMIASLLLVACQPDAHKEVGAPRDILSTLQGTWKLTKVTQTDAVAADKNFPYKELDLTTVFPYNTFSITFNLANGLPSSFTTVQGTAPKIIRLASGNWKADNNAFPKVLALANGPAVDTATISGYPTGNNGVLKMSVERREAASNKILIRYSYEFTKQ